MFYVHPAIYEMHFLGALGTCRYKKRKEFSPVLCEVHVSGMVDMGVYSNILRQNKDIFQEL